MAKRKAERQRTLKKEVRYSGIALHTGVRAHLKLLPAPANSGITLRRIDVPGKPEGPALATNVTDVQRATTLTCGDSHVQLVEHVFAALYGMGVDNAVIEMDGPEPPVGDGSALPYTELIEEAGTKTQRPNRRYCVVDRPFHQRLDDCQLILLPAAEPGFRITCTVSYGVSELDTQFLSVRVDENTFRNQLAPARTFCENYEVIEGLMKAGLIRGASLDNAMVVRDGAIISKDGLRFDDELVRHKMLDIVGDLSLIGRRIHGEIVAVKPGHPLNVALAKKIVNELGYVPED